MNKPKPKAPAKRKAPRRNTGRSKELLLIEKIIIHARPVKSSGPRHISEILAAIFADLERRAKR